MIKWMDKAYMYGATAKHIKGNGQKIDYMVKANFIGLMDLIIMENTKMIKDMEKVL